MDRNKIREYAHEVSVKMMEVLYSSFENNPEMQGPEDQIYLLGWVLGIINAGASVSLENYVATYQMETMSVNIFKAWVKEIEKEIIATNKDVLDGIVSNG